MTQADNIENKVDQMNFKSSSALRDRILSDATQAMEQTIDAAAHKPSIGRMIMTSKISKLAVAAALLIAVLIGIGIPIDGASVALADVAKRIQQAKNCVFKKTLTLTPQDNKSTTMRSVIHYQDSTIREDVYDGQDITSQNFIDSSKGIFIWIDHQHKAFKKINLTDEDLEKLAPTTLDNIINRYLSKGKYRYLGKKQIDEIDCEGFRFDDKRAMLSIEKEQFKNIVNRLWVDVNTKLPIRFEIDCMSMDNAKLNMVQYDPQWNVELKADFFEPKIPADYINVDERGMLGINLEDWPTLKVTPDSAAQKAGIKNGDLILKVNGSSIETVRSGSEALNLMRGKAGEKAVLTVQRGEQILTIEVIREPWPQ